MRPNPTPALDTHQVGRYAGQEAQPAPPPIRWFKITHVNVQPDGTSPTPTPTPTSLLSRAKLANAAGTTTGQTEQAVALTQAHAVGDLILVCQPGGGTTQTVNGVAVVLQEVVGGLPPGTGRYKVLMIMDDNSPGTPGWDFERFS